MEQVTCGVRGAEEYSRVVDKSNGACVRLESLTYVS